MALLACASDVPDAGGDPDPDPELPDPEPDPEPPEPVPPEPVLPEPATGASEGAAPLAPAREVERRLDRPWVETFRELPLKDFRLSARVVSFRTVMAKEPPRPTLPPAAEALAASCRSM